MTICWNWIIFHGFSGKVASQFWTILHQFGHFVYLFRKSNDYDTSFERLKCPHCANFIITYPCTLFHVTGFTSCPCLYLWSYIYLFSETVCPKGQLISKCLWSLQFLPKNERKQVNLRYSIKVYFFVRFWENWAYEKVLLKITDLQSKVISNYMYGTN